MRRRFLVVLAFALLALPACGGSATGPVLSGTWGGRHLELVVTAEGATLEFDCAQGFIDETLQADSHGRFEIEGRYIQEHGGPIREGEPPDEHPARYAGRINGRTMELTVTLLDSGATIGTYTLTRGAAGFVVKCL
jgi:hypothetical protein